jgi:putative DNA primase/helicase
LKEGKNMKNLVFQETMDRVKNYLNADVAYLDDGSIKVTPEEVGFIKDRSNGSFNFNANLASICLKDFITVIKLNGRNVIYNYDKGIYEPIDDELLSKISKTLLESALPLFGWNPHKNKDFISSFMLDIPTVETDLSRFSESIAVKEGIINLRTGEITQPKPKYIISRYIDISYNTSAECPKFEKFLNDSMCGDNDLNRIIQEVMGYILLNNCKAEKLFIFNGTGCNGKSVLMNVLFSVLGNSAISTIPLSDFEYRFGLKNIMDKMLNIISESDVSLISDGSKLKLLASGEPITVNQKHMDAIEIEPKAKLIFLTNNLPILRDWSKGMQRKFMIVPFNNVVTADTMDVNLISALKEEREGIFRFMVEGSKRLIKNKYQFSRCAAIDSCAQTYYRSINPVESFVEEMIYQNKGTRTPKKEILNTYKLWLDGEAIASNGTDSPQLFWRAFEQAILNIFGKSPIYKSNRGYANVVDFNIRTFDNHKEEPTPSTVINPSPRVFDGLENYYEDDYDYYDEEDDDDDDEDDDIDFDNIGNL